MRMPRSWSAVGLLVMLGLLISYQNCGGQSQPSADSNQLNSTASANQEALTVNGTVQQSNLDGCSFLISAVDNTDGKVKNFIPINMDTSLLQNGNTVSVSGVLRPDLVSNCMAGSILQVNSAQLVQ